MILFLAIGCMKAPTKTIQIEEDGVLKALPKTEKINNPILGKAESIDRDGDGKPDIWNYRSGPEGEIHTKVLDLNRDGAPDVKTYFNIKGQITKEQFDGDFDGQIDIEDIYKDNQRVESYIDTNTDGIFDTFRYYQNGKLVSEESNGNYDGRIDTTK